ncbi:MFS transporter [Parapedobacter sp. GCM10030251]|uniref:MFS transporter n=1 Tax=Parapedobacter sp. GCM10030251 TaxID=3273419 RepID=UPI00362426A4
MIQRKQLFRASCLALLVTSLSFGIRAGVLNELGASFHLSNAALSQITAAAFWGFPLAVIAGGFLVDAIGMKRMVLLAFFFHVAGILLTVFASGYWSLFFSTLLVGIANGSVEAACNPLVTALYPEKRTAMLNYFHLWFPGGIVIGTLIVVLFNAIGLNWQWQVGVMLLPAVRYGYLFIKLDFPETERVSSGIPASRMYKAVFSPLFLFMVVCMFGTAITELFTGQWIDVLLKNVIDNAILILTLTTGIMAIGRAFAAPVMKFMRPERVLLASILITSLGLYLLATVSGGTVLIAAVIFGLGVCYIWPTMLGFVAEYVPQSGALGMNLMAGAGMFAVTLYTLFMGGYYDSLILQELPPAAVIGSYLTAAPGTEAFIQLETAKAVVGPKVLLKTLQIPLVLIIAFTGLAIFMTRKNAVKITVQ